MPVYCDDFACTHVNGTIQDVKNYVTPFDPAVQDLAMELGFDIKNMFNWAQDAVKYVYPTKDYWQKPKETIKSLKGDCLTGDTEIIAFADGGYCIESLKEINKNNLKYKALSYDFKNGRYEFQPITTAWDRGYRETYNVGVRNNTTFTSTGGHKIYVYGPRWQTRKGNAQKAIELLESGLNEDDVASMLGVPNTTVRSWWMNYVFYRDPEVVPIVDGVRMMTLDRLREDKENLKEPSDRQFVCAKKIPSLGREGLSSSRLWIEGMYIAEGWHEKGHVRIANDDPNTTKKIQYKLNVLNVPNSKSKRTKHGYVNILKSHLKEQLKHMGAKSGDKHFLKTRLSMSERRIKNLIDGYSLGDGSDGKPYNVELDGKKYTYDRRTTYMTTSPELSKQLKFLHMILGRPLTYYSPSKPNGYGKLKQHYLYDYNHKRLNKNISPGVTNRGIKHIETNGKERVYDISVAKNHNFILADSGVVVSNCLDKAAALTSMLIAAGYPAWVSLVYLPKRREYHAYTSAMIDGGIKKLDPTCLYCSVHKFPDDSMIMLVDFDHTGLIQIYESD
ncbi:hypothetical protein LCGC14_0926520 [marine sediment metagenome]|uniref:DOD-type homing endonuclease domain-containing protein n=1 Tax=marine sediment metagenome TaxID=412755 RepID=A0A0F9NPC6_9ZZZZ